MKTYFERVFLVFLLVFSWPLMAATIKGTVKDSVTGKPIGGAKASCETLSCSTRTDTAGNFTLTIPVTEIFPLVATPPQTMIFYDPSSSSFYCNGEKISLLIANARGESMSGKLPAGQYFVTGRIAGNSGVFKFLNLTGDRQSIVPWSENTIKKKYLAKTAAGYKVNVSAPAYNPSSQTASLGQSIDFKLSPLPANGNFEIHLDSAGTVKIIPVFSD